jgi:hypothetical protein
MVFLGKKIIFSNPTLRIIEGILRLLGWRACANLLGYKLSDENFSFRPLNVL